MICAPGRRAFVQQIVLKLRHDHHRLGHELPPPNRAFNARPPKHMADMLADALVAA